MIKLKLASGLFSLALMATPVLAQDYVDQKVQELFAQGYTHFEISRGALRTEIEAYGSDFTKLEIVISNADGSVISESTEVQTPEEYQQNIDEISQTEDDEGEDDNGTSSVDANDDGEDDNGSSSVDANDDGEDDNGGNSGDGSDGAESGGDDGDDNGGTSGGDSED